MSDPQFIVDPSPAPKPPWLSGHRVLGIVFLIVVAAAIVAAVYYWDTIKSIPTSYDQILHKDPTANWKTYTNEQYGFELRIPTTWTVTEKDNAVLFISPQTSEAMKSENYEGFGGDLVFSNKSSLNTATPGSTKVITLNNVEFTSYLGGEGYESANYETVKNNVTYHFFSYSRFQPDQILSTFKFVEPRIVNENGYGFGYTDLRNADGTSKTDHLKLTSPEKKVIIIPDDVAKVFSSPIRYQLTSNGKGEDIVGITLPINPNNEDLIYLSTAEIIDESKIPNTGTFTRIYEFNIKTFTMKKIYEMKNSDYIRWDVFGIEGTKLIILPIYYDNSGGPCTSIWSDFEGKYKSLDIQKPNLGLQSYEPPTDLVAASEEEQNECMQTLGD